MSPHEDPETQAAFHYFSSLFTPVHFLLWHVQNEKKTIGEEKSAEQGPRNMSGRSGSKLSSGAAVCD